MEIKIIGIRKDNGNHYNPHEAISMYKSVDTNNNVYVDARVPLVGWLEQPGNSAYVTNNLNQKVYCYINRSVAGTRFLQTKADSRFTNNLLELPEF